MALSFVYLMMPNFAERTHPRQPDPRLVFPYASYRPGDSLILSLELAIYYTKVNSDPDILVIPLLSLGKSLQSPDTNSRALAVTRNR